MKYLNKLTESKREYIDKKNMNKYVLIAYIFQ